ncbi:BrnA antitoxin family protein [Candidatus Electronema sp. PJ]|uniref:BrnA antitoxin family protein n=1 Tax=Candidatus Electronema sp. PJ TaxID=3401572 RepID=UPI003AA954A8
MKRRPEHISQADWDAVDSPPLDNSLLAAMKPVRMEHPNIPPRVRGPQKAARKAAVSIRLDQAVVESFRATGRGWQARVNDILRDWLKEHKPA